MSNSTPRRSTPHPHSRQIIDRRRKVATPKAEPRRVKHQPLFRRRDRNMARSGRAMASMLNMSMDVAREVRPVWLNVGGVLFCTTRLTLAKTNVTEWAFGTGSREDPYFLDRDPEPFRVLLTYMRTSMLESDVRSERLMLEADHFGMMTLAARLRSDTRQPWQLADEDSDADSDFADEDASDASDDSMVELNTAMFDMHPPSCASPRVGFRPVRKNKVTVCWTTES